MNFFLTSVFANVATRFIDTLQLVPSKCRVAFIANAADPYKKHPWIEKDRQKLLDLGFHVEDIDLRNVQHENLRERLGDVDVIFVAGGSTIYLLNLARISGFMDIVPDLVKTRKIYVGSSAGSILAGPSIEPFYESDHEELLTMGQKIDLTDYRALGLVDFVMMPHYNKPKYREEFEKKIRPKFKDTLLVAMKSLSHISDSRGYTCMTMVN